MAKKSAKSKGYRKQNGKKPYLSKRDIVLLCLLVAAVVVAAVLLFRYDDGALKVKDGKVVTDGDNWLIVDGSNVRGRARYFKLGEVGEIEGYTRETSPLLTNGNVSQYTFTREGEEGTTVSVATSHNSAASLAESTASMLGTLDGYDVGEQQTGTFADKPCSYFLFTRADYVAEKAEDGAEGAEGEAAEAPAEAESAEAEASEEAPEEAEEAEPAEEDAAEDAAETEAADAGSEPMETKAAEGADAGAESEEAPEPNRFCKSLCAYIDAGHESCIVAQVEIQAPSAEEYPEDGALLDVLEQAAAAIALESGK